MLTKFMKGLEILSKYYDNPDGFHLGADHDVIYLYRPEREISDDDRVALEKLGFAQEGTDGYRFYV